MELTDFGSNPGALDAFLYVPESLPDEAPLVVVLHGCGSTVADMAAWTGWNELAEEHQFLVLYPQQRITNNLQRCFNWFTPDDAAREQGETASIKQMIDHVREQHEVAADRIFATGFSAGGAMTPALLAAYPELFSAGAALSGVPFAAANNLATGLSAMQGEVDLSPEEWAGKVKAQNPEFSGAYPRLAIFHGIDDGIVRFANAREMTEQWTYLFDLAPADGTTVSNFQDIAGVTYRRWGSEGNEPFVARYDMQNLGHAIAVDPGDGPIQGGEVDQFAKDIDFYSTYWTARFFGLLP